MIDDALGIASDGLLPIQAGFDAQEREMSNIRSFDWVSEKVYPMLTHFAAIAAVTAAGLFGWPYALVAGGGLLVFELARAHSDNQADLNRELVLYHHDIARTLGKSPDAVLSIQDMRDAADERVVGDKALKPLQMELQHLAFRSKYNLAMGAAHAVITTGAALLLRGALSDVAKDVDAGHWEAAFSNALSNPLYKLMFPITGALGAATGVTVGAEWLGKEFFHTYEPPSVYPDLIALQNKAKQQAIQPEEVFSVIVKLDHALADEIRGHTGKPYGELTYRQKEDVIQVWEEKAHAEALAKGINDGALPVTAIALVAFHQMEWPKQIAAEMKEASSSNAIGLPMPVIGISGADSDSCSVRAMMTQIRDAGAVPLFLSNHVQRDPAADIRKIDALIVMGNNGDIDPALYSETAHAKTMIETDKARAHYEFAMLQSAIAQKMPVLGVCGGMQRINVLLGGSLHQHVPDLLGPDSLSSQQEAGIPPFCAVEAIHLQEGTKLAAVAQGIRSLYAQAQQQTPEGDVMENSMHHQAVNRLGKGLRVSATSNGIITEAIEPEPNGPLAGQFLLGVQWHPEFGASPLGPRIAEAVTAAGQAYAHTHQRVHPMHEAVDESLMSSAPAMHARHQAVQPGMAYAAV